MKSIDRYGNSVQLTYNGKKSFPSFFGGLATIISILMVSYWWLIALLSHWENPYRRYQFSSQQYLTAEAELERPVYAITKN